MAEKFAIKECEPLLSSELANPASDLIDLSILHSERVGLNAPERAEISTVLAS
jgi:hypothetical protein